MKHFKIGLLGLGQIGGGVYQLLSRKKAALCRGSGVHFDLVKIAEKDPERAKLFSVPAKVLTAQAEEVVRDPEIDCVVELIGGIYPAKNFVITALKSGKDVVTANKALIAEHGKEIFSVAAKHGRQVFFEASVGGGIPVIKALREGLISNDIESIHGIINGTSNYILTRMSREGLDFETALQLAQKEGYAERNPGFDVDGIDSAHKLAILASLAFREPLDFGEIGCEGIRGIDKSDIAFAAQFGYVIKLLAIGKKTSTGVEARVQPTLISRDHILAKVEGVLNAIFLRGDEVGDILLYGRGAGARPTASAVVSDLVDLASGKSFGENPWLCRRTLRMKPLATISSRYYFRFSVIDKPGVLAKISGILGAHKVGISDVIQMERKSGNVVPLIMLTHDVNEKEVHAAIAKIRTLAVIRGRPQVLRIEA